MKKLLLLLSLAAALTAATPKKPKLVVAIVIDQFRYDYLTRFRAEYHGWLRPAADPGRGFHQRTVYPLSDRHGGRTQHRSLQGPPRR